MIGRAETVWIDGYRVTACTVDGGAVSYVREAYRAFRLSRFGRAPHRAHSPGRDRSPEHAPPN